MKSLQSMKDSLPKIENPKLRQNLRSLIQQFEALAAKQPPGEHIMKVGLLTCQLNEPMGPL